MVAVSAWNRVPRMEAIEAVRARALCLISCDSREEFLLLQRILMETVLGEGGEA